VPAVLEALASLEEPARPRELARVQVAIVKLAGGDRVRFAEALEQARSDWRDTLCAAGLENEDWPDVLRAAGYPVPDGAPRSRRLASVGAGLALIGTLLGTILVSNRADMRGSRWGCIWGCPEVQGELVVEAIPSRGTAGATLLPDPAAEQRALRELLSCGWGRARHTTVFYDGDQKPLRFETDQSGDGRIDEWEYLSGAERPSRIERDCNGDGRVDRREFLDAAGQRTGYEIDVDFDGTPDARFPLEQR
jgi:hypothetical protein